MNMVKLLRYSMIEEQKQVESAVISLMRKETDWMEAMI